jgi:predicted TIM-barrel fold metal-dependent hydrolase
MVRPSRFSAERFLLKAAGEPEVVPPIVDAHCHAFNGRDLPLDGFLRNFIAGAVAEKVHGPGEALVRFADPLLGKVTAPLAAFLIGKTLDDAEEEARIDQALASDVPLASVSGASAKEIEELITASVGAGPVAAQVAQVAGRVAAALSIVTAPRYQVTATMLDDYPKVDVFTPALVDFDYWTGRRLKRPPADAHADLRTQVRLHSKISLLALRGLLPTAKERRSACIHPYVPFNPWRQVKQGDALEIVKEAVETHGFVGVKLYPATGFLPTQNGRLEEFQREGLGEALDGALEGLYAYCEAGGVPIQTHASFSNGFGDDLAWRGSPWGWAEVLEKHGDLRIDFGHFGHMLGVAAGEIKEKELLDCLVWAKKIAALMQTHAGVYADLSNSPAGLADPSTSPATECPDDDLESAKKAACYPTRYRRFLEVLIKSHPKTAERILYGSDWWMNALDDGRGRFFTRLETFMARGKAETLSPGFFGVNALAFLGLADLDGATAKRLRKFVTERAPGQVSRLVWDV